MAAGGKKQFKLTLKYDVLTYNKMDLTRDSASFVADDKELAKLIKPLEFKVDSELDERKWNPRKLEEDGYYAFRMSVKLFDQAIKKAKEKGKPESVKKAYAKMEKDAELGFENWLKDLESGKADNAKALKDGKTAFAKMEGVEFKGAFDGPRKSALEALSPLMRSDKPDPQQGAKVLKALEAAKAKLDSVGKDAEAAINFLLRTAKQTKNDKDVDPELKAFATEVSKNASEFEVFISAADDLTSAFDMSINALKKGAIEKEEARNFIQNFMSLKPLDKHAQDCMKLAKKLKPQFQKIEKKLG